MEGMVELLKNHHSAIPQKINDSSNDHMDEAI